MSQVRLLIYEPMAPPYEFTITPDLARLQSIVQGYIEMVSLPRDGLALFCNEDGKLTGLPLNRPLGDDIIRGTFYVTRLREDGESEDLTEEDLAWLREWLP